MKNKRLTKTAVLLIGIMLTFSMARCATAQSTQPKGDPFPGQWYDSWNKDTYTFNSDGTGTIEIEIWMRPNITYPLTWTASGDTLTANITAPNESAVRAMTYSRSGDTLTWSDSNGQMFTLHRPGKDPAQQQVAQQPAQQQPAQQPAQQQAAEQQTGPLYPPPQPAPANPEQPYTIVGTWYVTISVRDGTATLIYTYNSDGTGTSEYINHVTDEGSFGTFPWNVKGNVLTTTGSEAISRTYSISGNTLSSTMGGGGGTQQYTRAQPRTGWWVAEPNPPSPVGTWRDNAEEMYQGYIFNADGTGTRTVNGGSPYSSTSNLTWTRSGNRLTLTIVLGNGNTRIDIFTYRISGNKLSLGPEGTVGYFKIYTRQ